MNFFEEGFIDKKGKNLLVLVIFINVFMFEVCKFCFIYVENLVWFIIIIRDSCIVVMWINSIVVGMFWEFRFIYIFFCIYVIGSCRFGVIWVIMVVIFFKLIGWINFKRLNKIVILVYVLWII